MRSRVPWLMFALLLLPAGRAGSAPAAYRLALDGDGLCLYAPTVAGESLLVRGLRYRASWADGAPAFATRGAAAPAPAGDLLDVPLALDGPAARDASVTLRMERRERHVLLTWKIAYRGPEREFQPWTSGFSFDFARPAEEASTDTPVLWRRPEGKEEWEVAGDTPYPAFEWQMRRVGWKALPRLVIATDWYDPDWIYGRKIGRASFHRAGLPKGSPVESTYRMALFVLPQAGEPGEALAAEAPGRPASLMVEAPLGFLFGPGQPVEFALHARRLEPGIPCRLAWDVWDYYGERVAHGDEAAVPAGRGLGVPVSIRYARRGVLFLDARLRWEGGGYERRSTFGILPARPITAADPASSFGLAAVTANPETYPDQLPWENVVAVAQRIGVRWLRGGGFPLKAEISADEEAAVRRRVESLRRHGISLHAQIGSDLPAPDKVDEFKAALRATLARFGNLTGHVEVGNELNFGHSAADYVERLLRPAAEVTRAAAPGAKVVTMGLGGVNREWLAALEKAGGRAA